MRWDALCTRWWRVCHRSRGRPRRACCASIRWKRRAPSPHNEPDSPRRTARLGHLARLDVKSRIASSRYCQKAGSEPAAIGRALGVANLVNGSVRRDGRRLRVTVELVRSRNGDRLWGGEFDRADADLLDIEQDIATAVGSEVAGHLDPTEQASLTARATRQPLAYDHFLRGNRYLAQRTERSVGPAITEYDAAVRLDPRFVEALARLAYG